MGEFEKALRENNPNKYDDANRDRQGFLISMAYKEGARWAREWWFSGERAELVKAHDEMVSINKALQDVCKKVEPEMSKLISENQRLREAFEYIADVNNEAGQNTMDNPASSCLAYISKAVEALAETGGDDG